MKFCSELRLGGCISDRSLKIEFNSKPPFICKYYKRQNLYLGIEIPLRLNRTLDAINGNNGHNAIRFSGFENPIFSIVYNQMMSGIYRIWLTPRLFPHITSCCIVCAFSRDFICFTQFYWSKLSAFQKRKIPFLTEITFSCLLTSWTRFYWRICLLGGFELAGWRNKRQRSLFNSKQHIVGIIQINCPNNSLKSHFLPLHALWRLTKARCQMAPGNENLLWWRYYFNNKLRSMYPKLLHLATQIWRHPSGTRILWERLILHLYSL